jgi:hypothetical protein
MKVFGFYHENTYQMHIPTREQNCYQEMLLADDENTNKLLKVMNQGWFEGNPIGDSWIQVRVVTDELFNEYKQQDLRDLSFNLYGLQSEIRFLTL